MKHKLKKAPQAPRRFKSAYMFYSTWKHKDIREQYSKEHKKIQTPEVAKIVSKTWKQLTPEQRAPWDEMARKDKARFELEKSLYDGPWKVPDVKDPLAPKRPVSAFLLFSKAKRNLVKRDGRFKTTTEISSVLSKMWKEASAEERKEYLDRDMEDRKRYKKELLEYQRIVSEGRCEREALAARFIEDETKNHRIDAVDEELSMAAAAVPQQQDEKQRALEGTSPGLQFAEECCQVPLKAMSSAVASDAAKADCFKTEHYVQTIKERQERPISSQIACNRMYPSQDPFYAGFNEPSVSGQRDLFDVFTRSNESGVEDVSSWDPIPLTAPVADFDVCSESFETDFTDSPLAIQSTMSDASLRIVTPLKRAPFSYVRSERHHRLPFSCYPPHHDQRYRDTSPRSYHSLLQDGQQWRKDHSHNDLSNNTMKSSSSHIASFKQDDEHRAETGDTTYSMQQI